MSSGPTMPLAQARELAEALRGELGQYCERIEVAGSIRRGKPDVGDIELVAVPELGRGAGGLFGDTVQEVNRLDLWCEQLLATGTLTQRLDVQGRPRWGPRYKAAVYCGMAVDLFSVLAPAQFGVIYLIRTGPAQFGHHLVTPRRQGGWLPDYLRVKDGAIWHEDGARFPTPEEVNVFDLLRLEYLPPEARTDTAIPVRLDVVA